MVLLGALVVGCGGRDVVVPDAGAVSDGATPDAATIPDIVACDVTIAEEEAICGAGCVLS